MVINLPRLSDFRNHDLDEHGYDEMMHFVTRYGGQAGQCATTVAPPKKRERPSDPSSLGEMIAMRLHLDEGSAMPFEHLHAFKLKSDKVAVCVAVDGQAQIIEDDWALFPSDTLITKLRLLEQK